jgi:hypothetical protein
MKRACGRARPSISQPVPSLLAHLVLSPTHTTQRLTSTLALDKPYEIRPVPRPKGW